MGLLGYIIAFGLGIAVGAYIWSPVKREIINNKFKEWWASIRKEKKTKKRKKAAK